MNQETIYAIALSVSSSPGAFKLWDQIHSNNPENIFILTDNRYKLETAEFIKKNYGGNPVQCAEKIAAICGKNKIDIIHLWDERYPPLLREISCPPVVLYSMGNLNHRKTAAIVGTRESDSKSENIAARISSELGENGITIASGIAIGIDRAAHLGALKFGHPTIAVMANGIDVVYPKANRDIYSMILKSENSLILSEYPPGIVAGKWTFVRRNRIISGISLGTIVVKAGIRSGALITARYALEQNRHVFACGGYSFDEGYEGCYRLLKDGGVPVYKTDDILHEFGIPSKSDIQDKKTGTENIKSINMEDSSVFNKNSLEKKIMSYLLCGDLDFNDIIRKSGMGVSDTVEAIMNLELNGLVSRKGNLISLTG